MTTDDVSWNRSSACGSGACVLAARAGRLVLVRDSKQGAGGVIQQWTADEWTDLLNAIKLGVHHVAIDVLGAADVHVRFGLHRHEPLEFAGAEWNAFIHDVDAGEFEHATMRTYASTLSNPAPSEGYDAGLDQVGDVGGGSDHAATGAGEAVEASGEPVPVAAPEDDDERQAREDWQSVGDEPVETPEQSAAIVDANLRDMGSRGLDAAPAGTVVGLDAAAIVDLVVRFGEARFDRNADRAGDLLDAIRVALVPVTAVEPEPRWGAGPLVEHNPEVWSGAVAPGGYVCGASDPTRPDGICGMPVESEPCPEHIAEAPNSCCLSGQLSDGREHSFSCKHNPETPADSRLREAAVRAAVNGGADPVLRTPGAGSADLEGGAR